MEIYTNAAEETVSKIQCLHYTGVLSTAPQHKTKEQQCNFLLFLTQLHLSASLVKTFPDF